jgi:hypothetical protein
MNTPSAFKFALALELGFWLLVGDTRIVVFCGLCVFAALRGLHFVRQ